MLLRSWFEDEERTGAEKARMIVERALESGLERFVQPAVLPPIEPEDIDLICWMAVAAEAAG